MSDGKILANKMIRKALMSQTGQKELEKYKQNVLKPKFLQMK